MQNEKSLSRYILVVLAISITITAIVLIALSAYTDSKKTQKNSLTDTQEFLARLKTKEDAYRLGYQTARDKYSSHHFQSQPKFLKSFSAKIENINGNELKVSILNIEFDKLTDGITEQRYAYLKPETVIKIQKRKDLQIFNKELRAWSKKHDRETPPPNTYTVQDGTIKDIKKGDVVLIKTDKDVLFENEFNIKELRITK